MIVDRGPQARSPGVPRTEPNTIQARWTTRENGSAIDGDIYGAKALAFLNAGTRGMPAASPPRREARR